MTYSTGETPELFDLVRSDSTGGVAMVTQRELESQKARAKIAAQRRELRRLNLQLAAARWALVERYGPEQPHLRMASFKADNDKARTRAQRAEEKLSARGLREDALRARVGELESALRALHELPHSILGCQHHLSGDADGCPACQTERDYRKRCAEVDAQVVAALSPAAEGET